MSETQKKAEEYLVWIEIELNDEDGVGTTLDAPGASVVSLDTYEEAWKYAEQLSELASLLNARDERVLSLLKHTGNLTEGPIIIEGPTDAISGVVFFSEEVPA